MRPALGRVVAAALLPLTLAACSGGTDARGSVPAPASTSPTPAAARYSGFGTPCPSVAGRRGTRLDSSIESSISVIVECAYGDRSTFPHVDSISTINKPGNVRGTPDQVTEQMFADLRSKAQTSAADGVSAQDRPGLGDAAFVVVSYKNNVTLMVVRSANALVQASLTVDAQGDRDKELADLRAQEPVVTELARALLAELR